MRSEHLLLLGALLIAPVAADAAQSRPVQLVDRDEAEPLTLTSAKQLVAQALLESGQRTVRVGSAVFDGNGNVLVEIQTSQGVPLHQVLVDKQTHQLAAVKGRSSYKG